MRSTNCDGESTVVPGRYLRYIGTWGKVPRSRQQTGPHLLLAVERRLNGASERASKQPGSCAVVQSGTCSAPCFLDQTWTDLTGSTPILVAPCPPGRPPDGRRTSRAPVFPSSQCSSRALSLEVWALGFAHLILPCHAMPCHPIHPIPSHHPSIHRPIGPFAAIDLLSE